ncbi:MAG: sulfatase-like hydrolase/transferase [Chloroflexota bacterium]|nr:sulfatase-like hydrolase/transferase [Chloroflexota bacterium]MDE2859717.1 sulfatase-like hydrolase/transferase [Chloroflexota bacterium]
MKPNILLIYTDQQRFDTIRALGNGHILTPNLDRLVGKGVAFTQATTPSPVCLVNRWCLHSGQWSSKNRCYSNHHPGLRPPTDIPNMLRDAGYVTGLSGKNHSFLTAADFDYWDENPTLESHPEWEEYLAWTRYRRRKYPRLAEEPVPTSVTAERAKTESALRFMDRYRDSGQPFFLWLSYLYPHTPYEAPEPYFSLYDNLPPPAIESDTLAAAGKPFRQQFHQHNNDAVIPFSEEQINLMRRVYYGMVTLIDGEIGKILDFLDERGLANNTLLVFTSDHGDYQGDHGLIAKSPALYDVLARVPFILRWPGHIDAGRRDDRFASHVDLLPTFAAAAGLPCPPQAQGVNLLPCLRDGGDCGAIRPFAFSEYGVPGTPYDKERLTDEGLAGTVFTNPSNDRLSWEGNPVSLAGRIRMLRDLRWKLVDEENGGGELYDLQNDPHELRNLWDNPQYSAIRGDMQSQLENWQASIA